MNNRNTYKRKKGVILRLSVISACIIIGALAITALFYLLPRTQNEEVPPEKIEQIDDGRPEITEVKGVWVPTVYNITFPTRAGLGEDELKAELDDIIETTARSGLNTIFFQVRPSCDSLCKSEIFPASQYLSDNGELTLDCLGYLVEKAHAKKIAVHAWINPLRVSVSAADVSALPDSSPAKDPAVSVIKYDSKLYFDPGDPKVRELVCEGVREIARNYKVDGIVFDDYFYPYPVYEENEDGEKVLAVFNDEKTYSENSLGKTLADFRRDNINSLIKSAYEAVKAEDEKIKFGVSPFGIWQNDNGENGGSLTHGTQSYSDNYSDTLAWVKGGYVDYIAPQLYWNMTSTAASYKVLAKWWNLRVSELCAESGHDVDLYIAHAAYRYADSFESGEITEQLTYASALESYKGSIFYAYNAIRDNENGVTDEITSFYNGTTHVTDDSGKAEEE